LCIYPEIIKFNKSTDLSKTSNLNPPKEILLSMN